MKSERLNMVKISAVLIAGMFIFFCCNKDNMNRSRINAENSALSNNLVDNDAIATAQDAEIASAAYNETSFDEQELLGLSFAGLKSAQSSSPCRTITVTPSDSVYPHTITINYDAVGCTNWREKYKSGKIIISVSAPTNDSLSLINVTFDSLTINNNKIEGTKTLEYLGKISGNPTWKSEIIGGKVTTPSGKVITYDLKDKIITWIAGYNTPGDFWDDVYSISGTSAGTSTKDTLIRAYNDSISIANPLILAEKCRYPQGGVENITVKRNGVLLKTVSIDYGTYAPGSNSCKSDVTLTVNGQVINTCARD